MADEYDWKAHWYRLVSTVTSFANKQTDPVVRNDLQKIVWDSCVTDFVPTYETTGIDKEIQQP